MKSPNPAQSTDGQRASRFCVHFLSGSAAAPKTCLLNGECYHCAYDQWLDHLPAARDAVVNGDHDRSFLSMAA